MNLIKLTILTSCTVLSVNAATILESDFVNRTVSGTTANATFIQNGLTTTGDVTVTNTTQGTGSGDFFTTPDADDRLAIANNLSTGDFALDFGVTIGAADIIFGSVELDLATFSNSGTLQALGNFRPLDYTLQVVDSTGAVIGFSTTLRSNGDTLGETITLSTAPTTLLAGSAVTFRVLVDGTGGGVNGGFEGVSFNGEIQAIPEPSSVALLALGGLALIRRKRS